MMLPQITEAPTSEIAMGMNTSDLRIFSPLARSMKTAYARPIPVDSTGTTTIHTNVLRMVRNVVGSENAKRYVSSPTNCMDVVLIPVSGSGSWTIWLNEIHVVSSAG